MAVEAGANCALAVAQVLTKAHATNPDVTKLFRRDELEQRAVSFFQFAREVIQLALAAEKGTAVVARTFADRFDASFFDALQQTLAPPPKPEPADEPDDGEPFASDTVKY